MNDSTRPMGSIKQSLGFEAAHDAAAQDRIEQQDRDEAKEKKGLPYKPTDKVCDLLGAKQYITDYTWTWLARTEHGVHKQKYVSRFFLTRNIALDMFMRDDEVPAVEELDFKRSALRDHGIRYFVLTPKTSLADLAKYLEENN